MKKILSRAPWGLSGFVISFVAVTCLVSKDLVYADDNLSSFQQEILFAKQKQHDISEKMGMIHQMLDQEKSSSLKKEAENLIEELSKKSPAPTTLGEFPAAQKESGIRIPVKREPPLGEVKPSPVKPQKKQDKKAPGKRWFWSIAQPSGLWPASYGNQYQFTEGQSLYRVAVSDKKVTLKEAIQIGVANNIELEALKKKVEVAESKLMEAKRALFPTLQATLDVNGGINVNQFYKGESRKVNINQPLFYGGELVFTMKQAEENLKISKAEYKKAHNEFIHQVRIAYYGVIKAEYNAQYQMELYERVHGIYKKVRAAHDQKLIAEVDFLNTESEYQQVYFQVESSKNDLLSADLVIHQTLGLDNNDLLPLDLKVQFKKIEASMPECSQLAFQNNPEVQAKEWALSSAGLGVKIYKAKKLPRVDLRGSYGMLGEAHERVSNDLEKEWFMGVHASMPLGPNSVEYDQVKNVFGPTVLALTGSEAWRHRATFNLFDKLADITDSKSAEAALLQSQSDYQKAKNDITVKLRDDFYNLQKSMIQIDASVSKMRYQEKQNGILEYLLGIQETTTANYLEGLIAQAQNKFTFIQAVTDYNLAVSSLGVSMGEPYYFDQDS